jgi:hypothetical protein
LAALTPADWQKMTQESRLGWPMVRERLVLLSRATLSGLQQVKAHETLLNDAMAARVAGIIEQRVSFLLQSLA